MPLDAPRQVLAHDPPLYRLIAEPGLVEPSSFADVRRLQDVVLTVLRKYVTKFFRMAQEGWETLNMSYREVTAADRNFQDYEVRIPRGEAALIAAVERLIAEGNRI